MLIKHNSKDYLPGWVWINNQWLGFYDYLETGPEGGKVIKVIVRNRLIRVEYEAIRCWPKERRNKDE